MLAALANRLTLWSKKWLPDAYVIAILLTIITALLVITLTPSGPIAIAQHWGDGVWSLLSFTMQMCMIIITGYILAVSPPVRRLMATVATIPQTPQGMVGLMAIISMSMCAINWGMGLVMSGLLAKAFARQAAQRNIKVDYHLLVATAYLGMAATWHAGLSGSATLLMATPGHFLEKDFGLVPVTQTTFSLFNLGLLAVVLVSLTLLARLLHPRDVDSITIEIHAHAEEPEEVTEGPMSPAKRLERHYLFNVFIGALGLIWLISYFQKKGFDLTLDVVNLIFLTLGLLLHRHPRSYIKAAEQGSRYVWGVIVQFPLYAGIFGMVKFSGLQDVIANFFISIATPNTFPLMSYWYSGLLNYIVPSGGSKWAIEAPYLLKAAQGLGVDKGLTILSYVWGEMLTDAIQPFFAIPLLGITQLRFSAIMGYLLIFFFFYAIIGSVAFLLVPHLGLF